MRRARDGGCPNCPNTRCPLGRSDLTTRESLAAILLAAIWYHLIVGGCPFRPTSSPTHTNVGVSLVVSRQGVKKAPVGRRATPMETQNMIEISMHEPERQRTGLTRCWCLYIQCWLTLASLPTAEVLDWQKPVGRCCDRVLEQAIWCRVLVAAPVMGPNTRIGASQNAYWSERFGVECW